MGRVGGWAARLRTHGLLVLVITVTSAVSLSATMINVALPVIVRGIGASAGQGTWLVLSYLLVHTCSLVLAGQLSDGGDARRVFLWGLGIFVVTSIVLALAREPATFMAARAVQGLAAAFVLSTAAAILTWTYEGVAFVRAMGLYLAGFAVAQAVGPVVGGLIASTIGWRWMFILSVMTGLAALGAGPTLLHRLGTPLPVQGARVDVPGNVVLAVALATLVVGLSLAQGRGWTSPVVLGLLAASVLLVPVLRSVERGRGNPAVDPALLGDRVFGPLNAAAGILNIPRVALITLVSLWFQGVAGLPAWRAGLIVTALPVGVGIGSVTLRWFGRRRGAGELVPALAVAAACATTALVPALLGGGTIATGFVLLLIGLTTGLYSTASATTLLRVAPRERIASANGIRTTFQLIGLTGGTAALLSIVTSGLSSGQARAFMGGDRAGLTDASVVALEKGYLLGFLVLAALTWFAAALSIRSAAPSSQR